MQKVTWYRQQFLVWKICLLTMTSITVVGNAAITNGQSELSASEIAKKSLPSVAMLLCENGNRGSKLGSGFFIARDLLVTNFHVVSGMSKCIVNVSLGTRNEKRRFNASRTIASDTESDLAILNVPTASSSGVPALKLTSEQYEVQTGETVYALGNPEGFVGTISPGIVSASLRFSNKATRIQITAPISNGSSGGPIVNRIGEVIGVAVSIYSEGQNLNFAVPSKLIYALIKTANIEVDHITSKEPEAELAKRNRVGKTRGSWLWPDSIANADEKGSTSRAGGTSLPTQDGLLRIPPEITKDIEETIVTVFADSSSNGWTNSGIIVLKGQLVRIVGKGRVSLGKGIYSDASGLPNVPATGKLLRAVPTGALIAVIGDDNNEFLYIGSGREITAQRDGVLFLGVNDGDLADNSGSFEVRIMIVK